jgi:PPOX class probable F420-dependent enzyme
MERIPEAFMDLLSGRALGHLATVMPDGTPHVTPVWVDGDGAHVLVNTAVGRVKDVNMRARPEVGIEILDPQDPYRFLSVRGRVVDVVEGDVAERHMDGLARRYTGRSWEHQRASRPAERRVLFKISPAHVYAVGPRDIA